MNAAACVRRLDDRLRLHAGVGLVDDHLPAASAIADPAERPRFRVRSGRDTLAVTGGRDPAAMIFIECSWCDGEVALDGLDATSADSRVPRLRRDRPGSGGPRRRRLTRPLVRHRTCPTGSPSRHTRWRRPWRDGAEGPDERAQVPG
jgi:hypothetical protein